MSKRITLLQNTLILLRKRKRSQKKNKSNPKIDVDRTYIEPQQFQSKKPKKDDQVFFLSRLNKPAKYKKRL